MRLVCCHVSQKAVTHRVVPYKDDTEREFWTILEDCCICGGKRILITRLQKDGSIKRDYATDSVKKKLLQILNSVKLEENILSMRLNNVTNLSYIPLRYANKGIKCKLLSTYTQKVYTSSQWDCDYVKDCEKISFAR